MNSWLGLIRGVLSVAAWAGVQAGAAWAGSAVLESGRYEGGLTLAVAPQDMGRVTGQLAVEGADCRVYFHGLPKGEVFQLAVITPRDDFFVGYGELHVSYDGDTPVVRLDIPSLPGCQKALPDLPQRKFRLQTRQPWLGVRLVQARRAHFHDEAHESTARKGYGIKWDAVALDRETPAFARVTYLGGKTAVTGWMRQEDLLGPEFDPQMKYVRSQLPPMQGAWPKGHLPVEVRAYLNARERCEHFEGEEGTDAVRQKFLEKALQRECADSQRRYAALRTAYAAQAPVLKFLKDNAPAP